MGGTPPLPRRGISIIRATQNVVPHVVSKASDMCDPRSEVHALLRLNRMTFFIKRAPVLELWHVLHYQVVHVALRQPREDKFRLATLLIVLWLPSARPAEMSTRRACP